MERTDPHRPSVIAAREYTHVAFDYLGGSDLGALMALATERAALRRHMDRTGGRHTSHEHGGTCGICGATAMYVSIFHHAPTNEYLVAGWECARKLELSQDDAGANRFRAAILDARHAKAGKAKAQALLADLGLERAWALADYVGGEREEQTARDIVSGLVRYGSLSDKQVAYLRTLLDRIDTRAERLAARAVENAAAADCPTGRIEVEGVVLSTKVQASDFSRFGVLKMLVKHDSGYKVWGTVPAGTPVVELKGRRVRFRATLKPSPNDPKFGFFSRPVALEVVA